MTPARKPVRVRIPPSPTGHLHIGTARTALFNWLFARQKKGVFVVRIEDTDKERSEVQYEEDILAGLEWLGLHADEGPAEGGRYGPYRQSERGEIYTKYLKQLLKEGHAYWCFCTKDELAAKKASEMADGLPPKYDGTCREIDADEAAGRVKGGESATIRFQVPEKVVTFKDLVRGTVEFDMTLSGDIVIAKGIDAPLYNFAVVVDDALMEITHVIRGEDHIANTPKQIIFAEALGFDTPIYAHLPLILGPDKSKLSKRAGETGLMEYKAAGYVPEAMLNFLVLMGWHPTEDKEVVSVEEMVKDFSFEKVQKGGAVYNKEKLDWLNGYYIRTMELDRLREYIKDFVPKEWMGSELFRKALEIERERMKSLADFKEMAGFFFEIGEYDAELLIWKEVERNVILDNLKAVLEILESGESFEKVEKKIMTLADERGKGNVLWPLRAALSGQKNSPGPLEIVGVLGVEESARRVTAAVEKLG